MEKSKLKEWGSFILELIICFIIVQLFVTFIARPIRVEGNSMHPTYKDQSIGVMYRFGRSEDQLKRFDVMVIDCKRQSVDELIIKRLIGLPGETVEMKDDHLYIDGKEYAQDFLDQDYVNDYKNTHNINFTNDFAYTLGEDEYFVLGDNRPYSADSRYFGVFHLKDFEGRKGFILYPFSEFGSFH